MATEQSLKVVEVATPADFDAAFDAAKSDANLVFALFTGAVDPATSTSWCPDCVKADPVILAALGPLDATLLHCPVQRAEYKGNPDYPYRKHKKAKIRAVPTLVRYSKAGRIVASLVEDECADVGKVAEIASM